MLFRGLCNLYRRFTRHFARIPAALNKKLPKVEPTQSDEVSTEEPNTLE